jgi:dTDP-4-amino-4,6-dideoxygalactose transaminase
MPLISGTPELQERAIIDSRSPWPLDGAGILFFSARYALFHALRALGLGPGDHIVVPAYCCGTEIDPILAAGVGIEWCDVEASLEVTDPILEALREKRSRAVLLTHYFGFDRLTEGLVASLRADRILLIEDCTHSFLSSDANGRPLGQAGDAAVFSLRKTVGIPDGGVLVLAGSREAFTKTSRGLHEPNRLAVWYRALELVRRSSTRTAEGRTGPGAAVRILAEAGLLSRLPLRALRKLTGLGAGTLVDPNGYEYVREAESWGMSSFSRARLGGDLSEVRARRRQNYQQLVQLSIDIPGVSPLFPVLPAGTCPLLCPMLLERRDRVREALARAGVDSHPWWGWFHAAAPWARLPVARKLKSEVLGLPVHQGLARTDMERIACALREALIRYSVKRAT